MGEERLAHRLALEERKKLTMTGVAEVVSFEEDAVVLKTGLGDLRVHGQGLKLKTLSPEGGQVELTGRVTALIYEEPRPGGSWVRRLLR